MKNDTRPLMVTICCITYNQEKYIRQCLEGFVMQKTNFRFEAIVHDDASTDGTADIIREYEAKYPDIIKPIYETENQYSKHDGSLNRIMEEHTHGKYVAYCEGDDYWIDPLKLQKQFDLLEKDATISFCHHNFYDLDVTGHKTLRTKKIPQRQDMASIAKSTATQTLTMFFRNYQPLIPKELQNKPVYSYFFPFRLAEIGDIYYIDEPMAVYRRNSSSIYGTKDSFVQLSMALTNIDNMIYWSKLNNRPKIVNILKKRALKMCLYCILHNIRRWHLVNTFKSIKKSLLYI